MPWSQTYLRSFFLQLSTMYCKAGKKHICVKEGTHGSIVGCVKQRAQTKDKFSYLPGTEPILKLSRTANREDRTPTTKCSTVSQRLTADNSNMKRYHFSSQNGSRMALSRVHTSAKDTNDTILLLLNKHLISHPPILSMALPHLTVTLM